MKKLLIAQAMEEFRAALTKIFDGKYQISTCADGNTALELIRTQKPDILILDLMLPQLDGITLLRRVGPDVPPVILATTRLASAYVLQTAKDMGIGYLMIQPCSATAVEERVADMLWRQRFSSTNQADPQVITASYLLELGIARNLDGFDQLRIAVPLFAQDMHQSLCKELYPTVAMLWGSGDGRKVERSMRKAIHTAWELRDDKVWSKYLRPNALGEIPRPSNKVFMSRLADKLNGESVEPITGGG